LFGPSQKGTICSSEYWEFGKMTWNFQIMSWASFLVDVTCYKIGTQHYRNYQSHAHENMHTHHDGCFVILLGLKFIFKVSIIIMVLAEG
jgi:hypothetical protein